MVDGSNGPVALTVGGNGGTTVYSGVMSGSGSLTKTGNGTFTLTNANTYTGNTTVNGGTLEIAIASIASNSIVTVAGGAMLQLDFATTNQVAALVLNGTNEAAGVYNYTTTPGFFTSVSHGSLLVQPTGPVPFTNSTAITGISLSGSNIILTGTNGQAGCAYFLLESTNLAAPISQWTLVATNVPPANGNYTFTNNVVNTNDLQEFYLLSNTNFMGN